MKYTSYKAIYTMLPQSIMKLSTSRIDNWAIQSIRQIKSTKFYEKKMVYLTVNNGVANLPDDFIKAYGVYYNHKQPTYENLKSVLNCVVGDVKDCPLDDVFSNEEITNDSSNTATIEEITDFNNRYSLFTIKRSNGDSGDELVYVARRYAVDDFTRSTYFTDCWTPLQLTDKLFTGCYMDSKSPNFASKCDYKYSFNTCNQLLTTLPDGIICLEYVGQAVDENGDYLIPDNMDYLKVLKDGIIYHYFEEEMIAHVQGTVVAHRNYEARFYQGVAYLRGLDLMPTTLEKGNKLRNIIYDRINVANNYELTGNSGWSGQTSFKHMNFN